MSAISDDSRSSPKYEEKPRRVFFALWPNDAVRRQLHTAAKRLHESCGGRMVGAEAIHLTLVFLGNVDFHRLDVLKSAAAAVSTNHFLFCLDTLGYWRHNWIAWAAPKETPEELSRLVNSLEEGLGAAGFGFDKRPYSPHITLVRNAHCRKAVELAEAINWQVEEFVLVESSLARQGSVYTIIARWPLS